MKKTRRRSAFCSPFVGHLGVNPPRPDAEWCWQLRLLPRLQTYERKHDCHCSIMTVSPAFFICLWHSRPVDPVYISNILLIFYFLLTAKFTRLCRLNQTSPPRFFCLGVTLFSPRLESTAAAVLWAANCPDRIVCTLWRSPIPHFNAAFPHESAAFIVPDHFFFLLITSVWSLV